MAPQNPNDLTRQQLDELDALLQRMLSLPLNKPEVTPKGTAFSPPPLPEIPPATAPRPTAHWRADFPPAPVPSKPPHFAAITAVEPEPAAAPAAISAVEARTALFHPQPGDERLPGSNTPLNNPILRDYTPQPVGTLRGVDAPATPIGFQSAFAAENEKAEAEAAAPATTPESATTSESTPLPVPGFVFPAPDATEPPIAEVKREPREVPLLLMPLSVCNSVLEGVLSWMGPFGTILLTKQIKTLLGWSGILLLCGAACWSARGMGWVSWPR